MKARQELSNKFNPQLTGIPPDLKEVRARLRVRVRFRIRVRSKVRVRG